MFADAAYHPAVDDLVFRPTRRQRKYDIVIVAVMVLLAVVAFLLRVRTLFLGYGLAVVIGLAGLLTMRGRTVVTSRGVQAVRRFRRRAWEWQEITNIDVKVERFRATSRWVRLSTSGGKSFTLPAPHDFDLARNPDFDEHVAAITSRWAQATGRSERDVQPE